MLQNYLGFFLPGSILEDNGAIFFVSSKTIRFLDIRQFLNIACFYTIPDSMQQCNVTIRSIMVVRIYKNNFVELLSLFLLLLPNYLVPRVASFGRKARSRDPIECSEACYQSLVR